MAFKAIQPHRRKVMTFAAELLVIIDGHWLAIRTRRDMTGDASRQAMLRRADASVHGRVPLMLDHLHMIAAHEIRRLDAAPFHSGL